MVNIYWLIDLLGTVVSWLNVKFCQLLGVSFHPKQVLRNQKYQSLLKFDFKMAVLRCFFGRKINLVQCILCGQYIFADRFLRMVEREVLSTFGCQFPSKRNFEKSKNTEVFLNLTLKWQC